jgi:hypothetical protein
MQRSVPWDATIRTLKTKMKKKYVVQRQAQCWLHDCNLVDDTQRLSDLAVKPSWLAIDDLVGDEFDIEYTVNLTIYIRELHCATCAVPRITGMKPCPGCHAFCCSEACYGQHWLVGMDQCLGQ